MSAIIAVGRPAIEAGNLRIQRDGSTILEDVSLTIIHGDVVCIRGVTGSGKSSLLQSLGLLLKPTDGQLCLFGSKTNCALLSRAELDSFIMNHFSYVFQDAELMLHWTAIDNIALPLIAKGYPKRERIKIAHEYCDKLDILTTKRSHRTQKPVAHLSGGQRQLVNIARALAKHTQIFLADEPTANLDTNRKSQIIKSLYRLSKEKQVTTIVVTHDNYSPEDRALFDVEYEITNGTVVKTAGENA